jgi:hypothetical protein
MCIGRVDERETLRPHDYVKRMLRDAYECLRLRNAGNISERRVTMLMAMMTSWITLANQLERYETLVKEELDSSNQ